jgi:hypothetical protein
MCLFDEEEQTLSIKEAHMNTIADELVSIQTSSESAPSMPSWFGEVALIVGYRRRAGRPDQDGVTIISGGKPTLRMQ